jgi:hypothetical protein
MCSTQTPPMSVAAIGQAIDDLAAAAQTAYGRGKNRRRPTAAPDDIASEAERSDEVLIRLAQVWAMLAELDPEVARRLPTYEA